MGVTAVILCGGAGSRLWPVSREQHPKPFIKMPDGQSLLYKTMARGKDLPGLSGLMLVSNYELLFKIKDELNLFSSPPAARVILEPFGRNTAPAIVAAALRIAAMGSSEEIMLVLPADHLINDEQAFHHACKEARVLAEKGRLVTFGIKPHYPETGYGYIEASGQRVMRFVEKPNSAVAQQYVASGNFFWNSGMFCFSARSILEAFAKHCPEVLAAVRACLEVSSTSDWLGLEATTLDSDSFALAPDISIDYAIMEKSSDIAMVAAAFDWNDIGSWESLCRLYSSDDNGNQLHGQAVLHNVHNCYIRSEDRVVGAVGVDDLLVVDTADALLVAHKSAAQDVKSLYMRLKEAKHSVCQHRRTGRPWGAYTVLEEGPGFKIKRIEVNPGASLSLQRHAKRSEHWVVVAGVATVTKGEDTFTVRVNESTYISPQQKHRLQNAGNELLTIIEVQSGSYLGEDDIERFDDIYQRI